MTKLWAILRDDGSVAWQGFTDGRTPSEGGDNPDGLPEIKLRRLGDLACETLDPATGRWTKDREREKKRNRDGRRANMPRLTMLDRIEDAIAAAAVRAAEAAGVTMTDALRAAIRAAAEVDDAA